jgi:DNA-binding XRE family transcriptional regulator
MTFAAPVDGPGPRSLLGLKAALSLLSSERDALLAAVRQTKDEGLVTQAGRLSRALDLFLHQHRRWDDEGEDRAVSTPPPEQARTPASRRTDGHDHGPHESVAAGIREYRIRNGLSQEDLADRAGLSVRALRYIESGRTRRPRPATMRLLSDAFGLDGADRDRFCLAAGTRLRSADNGSSTRGVA